MEPKRFKGRKGCNCAYCKWYAMKGLVPTCCLHNAKTSNATICSEFKDRYK